jgi:hypothetical protein
MTIFSAIHAEALVGGHIAANGGQAALGHTAGVSENPPSLLGIRARAAGESGKSRYAVGAREEPQWQLFRCGGDRNGRRRSAGVVRGLVVWTPSPIMRL